MTQTERADAALGEGAAGHAEDATWAARCALLLDALPDTSLYLLDRDGRVTGGHGALFRAAGVGASATAPPAALASFYPAEEVAAGQPAHDLARAARAGRVEAQSFRVGPDGRRFWAHAVLSALCGDDGAPRGFALVLRDMSEHDRAAQALQESELRYRAVSAMTSDYAYAIRIARDGRVVREWMTGAFTRITGFTLEEIEQRDAASGGLSIVHPDDRPIALARVQRLVSGQEDTSEFRIVTKLGEVRWIRESGRPETDANGVLRVYGAAQDVTERKVAEEEARARQAELAHVLRLGTMGEMAAGLAHEINQPLSAIVSFARGCTRRLRSGIGEVALLLDPIEEIAKQAMRANEIVQRLLLFVRKQKPARDLASIGDLVQEVTHLLGGEVRKRGVHLRLELASDLPPVEVDRIQIEQVILNLVRNALEATQRCGDDEALLVIRTERDDGYIAVAVTDQGEGLTEEQVKQVFEPFFTTKKSGLGMGLAISRSIVRAHGGRIAASANPDGGATFRFTLPVAGAA
jgi:two-component system sensor kinase FixL